MFNKCIKRFQIIVITFFCFVAISSHAKEEYITNFYHTNLLGSVIAVSNENGTVLHRQAYYPYGEYYNNSEGGEDNNAWYTSKPRDKETGLIYLNARYYDPVTGRFMSVDPMTVIENGDDHFNGYVYAKNNPYKYTDPSGQVPVETVSDALFVVYDLGKIGFGLISGNKQMVVEGAGDLIADSAALFIPYVPAGSTRIARATRNLTDNQLNEVTKGADSKLSRSGAFKEAKQKAGVPRSQHPDEVYREKIRDQDGYVEGRVYKFKGQNGSSTTIREHSLGHKQGNHGPHFNSEVRSADGIKQPLGGNGDSHTYFK